MYNILFLLLQRCTRWRDTGLTRLNPRDVAAAAGARARAAPRPAVPAALPAPLALGAQPAPPHLRPQALHSHSLPANDPALPKTLQTPPFPRFPPPFSLAQLSLLNFSLSHVSNNRAES